MAVRAYMRIRISGSLPAGEVWSVNPAFIGNFDETPPSHAFLETWAQAIGEYFEDLSTNLLLNLISSTGAITGVRAEYYDTTGRLADVAEYVLLTPKPGVGGALLPITSAVVCSLYTGIPGRSYRGRIYWPALGLSLDPDTARIRTSDITSLLTAFNDMLSTLQGVAPSSPAVVLGVYSKTMGTGTAISQLRVGNLPDQWRGRRDALTEAYGVVAFQG